MDEHFHNVSFDIINRFLDKLSVHSNIDKSALWSLWSSMFQFPVKKQKEQKKETKEAKEVKPVVQESVSQPAAVSESSEPAAVGESTSHETKESSPKKEPSKKKDDSPKKKEECRFVLTRGERSGQECGKPIAKKKSDMYCANHCK